MLSPEKPSPLVLALLAGLILAGCEATGDPSEPPPPPEPTAFGANEDEGTPLDNPPASPAMPYNGMATLPPINDDPQQLMGLDHESLNEMLGEPALVRRDGGAEVWQYRADRCVLDLFLYGANKKVEHVDLRNRGDGGSGDEESVRDCFVGMLRAALPST
ncbi:MAG: hypothetical protein ABFS30_04750 [Pseudomonadota bacterium]